MQYVTILKKLKLYTYHISYLINIFNLIIVISPIVKFITQIYYDSYYNAINTLLVNRIHGRIIIYKS